MVEKLYCNPEKRINNNIDSKKVALQLKGLAASKITEKSLANCPRKSQLSSFAKTLIDNPVMST